MAIAVAEALQRHGWYLTEEGISTCSQNGKRHADVVIKAALDQDLKEIGERHLQDGTGRTKTDFVDGPFVLQIQKLRNVSAPKDNEDSQTAPPLFKVTLSDGHSTCTAVEIEKVNNLGLNTPPGTKLKLVGRVPVVHGFLLLSNTCCKVLGGHVAPLVDSWQLKKSLAKHSRQRVAREGGPPLFIPFGQKQQQQRQLQKQQQPVKQQQCPDTNNQKSSKKQQESFKSLTSIDKKEDAEFEQQRRAVIAEALQAKGESKKPKTFTKQVQDTDVAKIVEMGFPVDQASAALRQSGGKLDEAINNLLTGGDTRPRGRVGLQQQSRPVRSHRAGRNEEDEDLTQARPSAPATLFDFLNTKIATKKDTKNSNTKSMQEVTEARTSSDGFHSTRDNDSSRRPPPSNLPPRLTNKHHHDDTRHRPASNDMYEHQRRPPPTSAGQQGAYDADTRHLKSDHSLWTPSEKEQRNNHHNQSEYQGTRDNSAQAPGGSGTRAPGSAGKGSGRQSQVETNLRPSHQERRSCIGGDINVNTKSYKNTCGLGGAPFNHGGMTSNPGGAPSDRGRHQQQAAVQSLRVAQSNTGQRSDPRSLPGRLDVVEQKMAGLSMMTTTAVQEFQAKPQNPMSYSAPPVATSVNYSSAGGPQDGYKQTAILMKPTRQWSQGDYCLARYWQDGQFYRAVVKTVRAGSNSCIVMFPDYGNTEQVSLTELQPITEPPPNWEPPTAPSGASPIMQPQQTSFVSTPSKTEQPFQGQIGGRLEFRQGGCGVPYRARPQQKFYAAPRQRDN